MHNVNGRAVSLTWLLLDSQLTVDLIANPRMLLNTRKVQSKDAIRVHCNSRVKALDRVGDLPGYGTVWYEPTGIANILSMLQCMRIASSLRTLLMFSNILGLAIRSTVNWLSREEPCQGHHPPVLLCMITVACPSKSRAPQPLTWY